MFFHYSTVTAVSNGLQAWKILEDLTNHIDLILTEVVMPGLTGIGLLSKIMSHKTWKNIPVISEYSSFIPLPCWYVQNGFTLKTSLQWCHRMIQWVRSLNVCQKAQLTFFSSLSGRMSLKIYGSMSGGDVTV